MDYYFSVLKKYAEFHGRSRPAEYWMFALANAIISLLLFGIGLAIGASGVIQGLYSFAVLLPSLAVSVRRLHDTNHSGWWLFIGLVPVFGLIRLVLFFAEDGTVGTNQYGHNPKDRPTCVHTSLRPHWGLEDAVADALLVGELLEIGQEPESPVADWGHGEHLDHYVCDVCGERFSPEEADEIQEEKLATAGVP